jgi:hypothetical protein
VAVGRANDRAMITKIILEAGPEIAEALSPERVRVSPMQDGLFG